MRFVAAFACLYVMGDIAISALSSHGAWSGVLWFGVFCWAFNAGYMALFLREQSSS